MMIRFETVISISGNKHTFLYFRFVTIESHALFFIVSVPERGFGHCWCNSLVNNTKTVTV